MYRNDYLMRLIESTAQMLHKVMNLRINRQLEEAMALIQQAMKAMTGLGGKLIMGLSLKDLLALLSKDGILDQGKVLTLGELMHAQGEIHLDEGDESAARQAGVKSLALLLAGRELDAAGEWQQEYSRRIENSLKLAGRSRMPEEVLPLLAAYQEEQGRYAAAEDALFHRLEALREAHSEDGAVYGEAVKQTMRHMAAWLELEEERLAAGGLSREEVRDSLKELEKIK